MRFIVKPSKIKGEIPIPGSKSHTIRALVCGLLADGESIIRLPLNSSDTRSGLKMIRAFGAQVSEEKNLWRVKGTGGSLLVPSDVVDIGNSGTSLYIGLGLAGIADGYTVFTGDHQIRNRPADPLLEAINSLGGSAFSTRGNGKPPIVVKGKIKGGTCGIEAHTSQYLTSLLLAAPLATGDTTIRVGLLNEAPYVSMTLNWLKKAGIKFENRGFKEFIIPGKQAYRRFDEHIAADFSSATFFIVAAAITQCELVLNGLDFTDTQGDKEVVNIIEKMGAKINRGDRFISIRGDALNGGTFDLNAIPDSLPALAVAGCFARGETRLVNVPQARLKETDRISVMCGELKRMGADIEELPDGLVIRHSRLKGAKVNGHDDHRVVMALSLAGLMAEGNTEIDTAESVSVTFPDFQNLMRAAGADIEEIKE